MSPLETGLVTSSMHAAEFHPHSPGLHLPDGKPPQEFGSLVGLYAIVAR